MRFGLTENSYTLIINSLTLFPEIETVIIYGSRSMGNHKPGSDIDLALKGEKIDASIVKKISTILNEELPIPYYVDVLNYAAISNSDLKNHIDEKGRIFFFRI